MSSPVSVIDQMSASMSVSSLQNQVTASNIANRDTQDYQRLKLRFDNAMYGAGTAEIVAEKADQAPPLEQDLVALSTNSMHYQSLARVLNRYFSMLESIANPNRG